MKPIDPTSDVHSTHPVRKKKVVVLDNLSFSMMNFNGTLLTELVRAGHEVHAWAPGDDPEVHAWMHEQGIHFQTFPLQRTGTQPLYDLYTCSVLFKRMLQLRPDVVLSFTVKPIVYGSWAAFLTQTPQIYSVITGLSPAYVNVFKPKDRWVLKLQQWMYRWSLCYNQKTFFYNHHDRDLFLKDALIQSIQRTCVTNGAGVPLEHFQEAPFIQEPHVLMIARLVKHKGIYEYAEAARRLKQRYPDARFSLLGPYHEHPDAIDLDDLRRWEEEGTIHYLGETRDVRPYLAQAGLCVLSTYREGVPRALLEAMAAGRALIASDVPGCREVVRHGKNGYLVPPREILPLVDAIEMLLCDTEKRRAMGQRSREFVEQRFEVHHAISPILDHINSEE